MSRSRRRFISNKPYELCFRAREGIPFPPNDVLNLIVESAIARTQRDYKVDLCHLIWMGNHVHMIIVALDARQCVAFYAELQKALNESLKRLLGIEFLHLWETRPMAAQVADADKMVERIAYLYANPARAHLVDSISQYPGVSSYREFKQNVSSGIESSATKMVPWIRPCKIKLLGTRSLTSAQARSIVKALRDEAKTRHALIYKPNAWMRCFGIKEEEIEIYNKRILAHIESAESLSRQERHGKGFGVIGTTKLQEGIILKPHTPKKKSRRIFFLASTKELRLEILEAFREFDARCCACYEAWLVGDFSLSWPPGAFRPPMSVLANAIA